MPTRETKELVAGQHKIIVLTYITAREAREIYSIIFDQVNAEDSKNEDAMRKRVVGKASLELQNRQIEIIVKSVDGNTEKILDRVLDLEVISFKVLTDYISEVMGEKKNTDEQKLSTSPDA